MRDPRIQKLIDDRRANNLGPSFDVGTIARRQTAKQLRDLEQTMSVSGPPVKPSYETVEDAAKTLGLDAEKTRVASRLIGRVADDARDLLLVSKAAREGGLPREVIPEILRRGMDLHQRARRGENIYKGGKPDGTKSTHGGKPVIKRGGKWVPDTSGKASAKEDPKKKDSKDSEQPDSKKKKAPGDLGARAKGTGRQDDGDPKKGDVHQRFGEIQKKAAKHGIKIRGKVSDDHTHDHLDDLEARIGKKVAGMWTKEGGKDKPGVGKKGAEKPPEGSKGPAEGEAPPQGGDDWKPPATAKQGSWTPEGQDAPQEDPPDPTSAHGEKQLKQKIAELENQLSQIKDQLEGPHQKGIFQELLGDIKSVKDHPKKRNGDFEWLARRVLSFIALVTGTVVGGALAGPGGAMAGAVLANNAVKSEAKPEPKLVIDKRSGKLLLKADKLPGGRGDDVKPGQVNREQLAMGITHELEHTKDPKIAREIAIDHLVDDADYYTKLKRMEAEKSVAKSAVKKPPPPPAHAKAKPKARATRPTNVWGHRDGLEPGMILKARKSHDEIDIRVTDDGCFEASDQIFKSGHEMLAHLYGRTDHKMTVRRYFKLGGERKAAPEVVYPLRSLLKSEGVLVQQLQPGRIVLTGDLAKAGVPDYMIDPTQDSHAQLDQGAAEELVSHLRRSRAGKDSQ